ncbi:MAG TPA: hypothetical protein DIV86_04510, partial [Alphaproteobacteria bacterium]|nr:hypothetical protein [Alphaproteobacteria bacterium]
FRSGALVEEIDLKIQNVFLKFITFDTGTAGRGDNLSDLAMSINSMASTNGKIDVSHAQKLIEAWSGISELSKDDIKDLPDQGRYAALRWGLTRTLNFISNDIENIRKGFDDYAQLTEKFGKNAGNLGKPTFDKFSDLLLEPHRDNARLFLTYRNPVANLDQAKSWKEIKQKSLLEKDKYEEIKSHISRDRANDNKFHKSEKNETPQVLGAD